MITRLVKLQFQSARVPEFLALFHSVEDEIRAFPGCQMLNLFQDSMKKDIYFTYSEWNSIEDLETYRSSSLFEATWSKTKTYFSKPAEAWSLEKIIVK